MKSQERNNMSNEVIVCKFDSEIICNSYVCEEDASAIEQYDKTCPLFEKEQLLLIGIDNAKNKLLKFYKTLQKLEEAALGPEEARAIREEFEKQFPKTVERYNKTLVTETSEPDYTITKDKKGNFIAKEKSGGK
jgi:hypothetical protein